MRMFTYQQLSAEKKEFSKKSCLPFVVAARVSDPMTTKAKAVATTTTRMLNDDNTNYVIVTCQRNRVDDANDDFESILRNFCMNWTLRWRFADAMSSWKSKNWTSRWCWSCVMNSKTKRKRWMRLSDHISNHATRIHDIHFIKYHDFF